MLQNACICLLRKDVMCIKTWLACSKLKAHAMPYASSVTRALWQQILQFKKTL